MRIYPLTSHAELSKWLKFVREQVVGASQLAMAKVVEGPSQPQVSRAESDPEFPLTQDLLRQLGAAFHQLAPDKFSKEAPSLVVAKAAAYAFTAPPADDRERQSALWKARTTAPATRMVLGVDLLTDELVTGTSLRLAQPVEVTRGDPAFTDMYVAEVAAHADTEFDEHVCAIAAWFQGVTMVEGTAPNLTAMIDYWNRRAASHNVAVSVHGDITRRLDPIAGIRSLSQAVSTVHELRLKQDGGVTAVSDHAAWILLLANMIGARDKISPIEAWEQYRVQLGEWTELYDKLDPALIKELPSIGEMLDAARPLLTPWANDSPTDGWAIGWTEDAAGNPVWEITAPDSRGRISPARGDLLVYGPNDNLSPIRSVLRRLEIPTASVTPAAAVPGLDRTRRFCGIRLTSSADTTPYAWAPTGIENSSYGLLRNELTKQWHIAQLY